ncbi:MAG: ABC transporter ATP-binding protein [Leptospirales bacterium]
MSFLIVQEISKTYKPSASVEVTALAKTDLTFKQGEFAVISGPSGSGKTTLLNMIGGLDAPTTGKVILNDVILTDLKEKELALQRLQHIGFIFQAYNLIPVLTAEENIEYILILQGVNPKERKERVKVIAEKLGIYELLNKRPNEMSGGQQQRVAVARAVVSHPALILADEPTANLDSQSGENLLKLMADLNREQKITIIFSSHDPMVIGKAKRHIVLKDGKIASDKK